MAIGGGRISLPLAVGMDCSHPQWLDLLLFFVGKVIGDGRWMATSVRWSWRWVAASGFIWFLG
jgi:hypothetical protein